MKKKRKGVNVASGMDIVERRVFGGWTNFVIPIVILLVLASAFFVFKTTGHVISAEDPCEGADINEDGQVGLLDFNIVKTNFGMSGATHSQGDANGDGQVGLLDFNLVKTNFGDSGCVNALIDPCGGADANKDGQVGPEDFGLLKGWFGIDNCGISNNWCEGADFNKDGQVGPEDFGLLKGSFGMEGCIHATLDPCGGADFNQDGSVDPQDFGLLKDNFGRDNCDVSNGWCSGTDSNKDGSVDPQEFGMLKDYFGLDGCTPAVELTKLFLITGCGVLNEDGAVYDLVSDVSTSGTCFNITGNDIALNLNGHKVVGDGSGVGIVVEPLASCTQNFYCQGDVNNDGEVSGLDFNIIKVNFGVSPATREQGDANGDGQVSGLDFNIIKTDFGKTIYDSPPCYNQYSVPVCVNSELPGGLKVYDGSLINFSNGIDLDTSYDNGFNGIIIDSSSSSIIMKNSSNNKFSNSFLSNSGDIGSGSVGNTFSNVSAPSTLRGSANGTTIARTWILRVSTNVPSNITVKNGLGDIVYTDLTAIDIFAAFEAKNGLGGVSALSDQPDVYSIIPLELPEYITFGENVTTLTPYSVTASAEGVPSVTVPVSLTSSQDVSLTLGVQDSQSQTICGELNQANTVYTLMNDVSSMGTCFNITADNITIDGKGFWINATNGHAISITSGRSNITIKNANLWTFGTSQEVILANGLSNSLIYNNTLSHSSGITVVFSLGVSLNNQILNNDIGIGAVAGLSFTNSTNDVISNNVITMPLEQIGTASYIINTTIYNNTVNLGLILIKGTLSGCNISGNNASSGITLGKNSSNNYISNNFVSSSSSISLNASSSDTLSNNPLSGSLIITSSANNLTLRNQPISSYTFSGLSNVTIINTTYGSISLFNMNGTGNNLINNLTSDIIIGNNLVYVNSARAGLNKSANVSLYGLPTNFANPIIFRDGVACPASMCTNYTSLNAGAVLFGVTGWSNYSIGEGLVSDFVPVTACRNLDQANTVYTLMNEVSSEGTCFNITANNVTLNGNGKTITYGVGGGSYDRYGVYVNGYNQTTVKNSKIYEGDSMSSTKNAIYLIGSNNNLIYNNTIVTLASGSHGVFLKGSSNFNEISTNNISITYAAGVQVSSSNNNLIYLNTVNIMGKGCGSFSGWGVSLANSNYSTVSSNILRGYNCDDNGISLYSSSNSIIGLNNIMTTGIGLGLSSSSNNNLINDATIISNDSDDVSLTSTSINNTFLNVRYSKESVLSGSQLIRSWNLDLIAGTSMDVVVRSVGGAMMFNGTIPVGETTLTLPQYGNTSGFTSFASPYNISAVNISGARADYTIDLYLNRFLVLSPLNPICIDSDEGIIPGVVGWINFSLGAFNLITNDSCALVSSYDINGTPNAWASADSCSGSDCYVDEAYCRADENGTFIDADATVMMKCSDGCSNGACIASPSCPAGTARCSDGNCKADCSDTTSSSGGGGGGGGGARPIVNKTNATATTWVDGAIRGIEGVLTGGRSTETPSTTTGSSTNNSGSYILATVLFYTIFIGTSVLIIGAATFFILRLLKKQKGEDSAAMISN